MPPLMLEDRGTFRLDYSSLFLFDSVIVDEQTYENAIERDPADFSGRGLTSAAIAMLQHSVEEYAGVLRALRSSGRLVTADFDGAFRRLRDLWTLVMDADMRSIGRWVEPLHQSVARWDAVAERVTKGIETLWLPTGVEAEQLNVVPYRPHALTPGDRAHHFLHTARNWKKRQPSWEREEVRSVLRDYLAYVNFNLILARDSQAAFVDWEDMQPFYDRKFQAAEESDHPARKHVLQSRKLFEILFPHFVLKSPKRLMRALEDKRVGELRLLIQQSAEGSVEFDHAFAASVLREILKLEHRAIVRRKICGWATLPLGLIPAVGSGVEKLVEEIAERLWANRPLAKYSWFYLINELDKSES
jgi:hypothetical protein